MDSQRPYTYDINGDIHFSPENTSIGEITATTTLYDVEALLGQGVMFDIITDIDVPYYVFYLSSDSSFNNIVSERTGTGKQFFVSFNSMQSGTYYWKIKIINTSDLTHSLWFNDDFYFEHQLPPYSPTAVPSGLTANDSDSDWAVTGSGFMDDYYWDTTTDYWKLFFIF